MDEGLLEQERFLLGLDDADLEDDVVEVKREVLAVISDLKGLDTRLRGIREMVVENQSAMGVALMNLSMAEFSRDARLLRAQTEESDRRLNQLFAKRRGG